MPGRHTMIFDGDCRVCTRIAEKVRGWDGDGRLEILPSTTPGLADRFPWIPAASYRESMQLVAPDGTTWQGAESVERILELLPRGRLVTWLFSLPFARSLAERGYRSFARNRYRFGCSDHCQL